MGGGEMLREGENEGPIKKGFGVPGEESIRAAKD